ncbi:hypothetical protein LTR84_010377 [Exophiala bonariae]|uniref:GED domain-containing protein n=1 Tax=Exophiala bonariae TaxID=1690606 RepID=A0AAV9MV87_9EURO|nr:hypothetical protein LTR84_010377 [Exophiala bonariae]
MGDAGEMKMPRVGLQTAQHEELLNIIDTLRSQGISRYVDLPQLIVCAISGLRFPTKDNLCTRFATELILRRATSPSITVTITPGDDRSQEESDELTRFQSPSTSIDDFANIVAAAEKAMGLNESTRVFAKDILRVELCGPSQPHLTLVDLPGIFWAGDKSQSDDDAKIVHSLVESYMKKSRSIILAVVSAKSDLAMQIITKLARDIDPTGERTLGIITKPDLLFAGSDSESSFVKLAKNENITFKLGWHVLKNRDYDTRNSSTSERDLAERVFFEQNIWSSALPPSQLGISALRPRLSKILLRQILRELPGLIADVESGLNRCKRQLEMLGGSRATVFEQRGYLFQASQTFVNLMTASIDGRYSQAFFGSAESDEGYGKRLRAVVQRTLKEFAEEMHLKGSAVKIVNSISKRSKSSWADSEDELFYILRDEYLKNVQLRMSRNRGRELPGLFNPDIIDDLFYDHAKPWQRIILATMERVVQAAETAIKYVLEEATDATTIDGIMSLLVRPNFDLIKTALENKAQEILQPHHQRRLLTFNHYFTDSLQRLRQAETQKIMADRLESFFFINPEAEKEQDRKWTGGKDNSFDVGELLKSLTFETDADMDRFAAIDAMNAMLVYYKVALKSVIDTFGMYAVEACLMAKIGDIFTPMQVSMLDDAAINRIAAESDESIAEREDLTKKLKVLEQTMKTMERLRTFKDAGV